jgi:prepilin-type N-terminal cleavage/methylation domain-containing protein
MQRKQGFTLAEVLITLSIIGVVAALTIPAIVGSTNKARATTSVKKAVSVLNQALMMSVADGSGANTASDNATLRSVFQTYLKATSNTVNSITSSDGTIYSFYKNGTNGCASTTNSTPATANCLIEVDINGTSGSSVVANATNYSDLYYLIIADDRVVPANSGVVPAISSFRNTAGAETGGVAQSILTNG